MRIEPKGLPILQQIDFDNQTDFEHNHLVFSRFDAAMTRHTMPNTMSFDEALQTAKSLMELPETGENLHSKRPDVLEAIKNVISSISNNVAVAKTSDLAELVETAAADPHSRRRSVILDTLYGCARSNTGT